MSREDQLLAVFRDFRDALFAQDVATLDRILAADYRSYNLRGHLEERDVILEAYAPGGVVMDRFEVQDVRTQIVGEVGIMTGTGYVAGSSQGMGWEHHLRFCDIYVEREGAWELFISHATPMEADPT